ncbi:histidine phosphatase family protein [Glaciimonas soli]|uniref:Histidine phosphatase family protein n=1 Tax=Glaciimonas soli TaxID=2590999 RepID=A0A843YU39_9BURK|nr:histidine phosphatase family protein [Glaciimonas soli]MQR00851.1 hypothetical protein [Glaciimonas soli]
MKIYLVRHAEPLSALGSDEQVPLQEAENHLSANGMTQAENLAADFSRILGAEPVEIFCSTLLRAQETAERIASKLGVDIRYTALLNERDFSPQNLKSNLELKQLQLWSYKNPALSKYGEETTLAQRARVQKWLSDFAKNVRLESDINYLIVCHGGTIEHLVATMMQAPIDSISSCITLCDHAHYHQISAILPERGWLVWRIEAINLPFSSSL